MNAAKLQVKTPLVELDGDEMTRIIWALIKQKLILPYLDIQLEYYDLGVENRDKTDDRITVDAAHAIARRGVGVKCATITPDVERVKEYSLKKAWPSPNATIRSILDGTVFRKPIVVSSIAPAVRSWRKPIVIGRHAYGDIYKAVDFIVPGPGTVELVYKPSALSGPSSASPPSTASSASSLSAGASHDQVNSQKSFEVYTFTGPGVVMGMHNTDASIASFAKACVNYALSEKLDIWFAAKDTISKVYHGRFRELFAQEVQARAKKMDSTGIR
jgi:isocitrate dehydrogenase